MSTPIKRSGLDLRKTFRGAGAIGGGVLVLLVAMLLLFGFNRVDDFEVAVKRNPVTGAVDPVPYRQGLYHSILRSWTNYDRREIEYPPSGQSERLAAQGRGEVERAADEARQQLRAEAAQLAVEISAQAIKQSVDEERQAALVDAFIEDLEQMTAPDGGEGD